MMSAVATVDEVFLALERQLRADGSSPAMTRAFARLADDRARVEFAHDVLDRRGLLPPARASARSRKDDAECARLQRQAENTKDNANEYHKVLRVFTQAVAHGLKGSENLGKAYLGRSKTLFKLARHRNNHELFLYNCRRVRTKFSDSLNDLASAADCANADLPAIKSLHNELISAGLAVTDILERPETIATPCVTHATNSAISCAGDSVSIKKTIDCGRIVVATKDIQIGEVIAVERAFVAVVASDPDVSTTHCHECLRLDYAPIPCDQCAFAMYCSDECKSRAWMTYHQYECPVAGTLLDMNLPSLAPIAIRLAIIAAPQYDAIETYSTDNNIREERYESDRYREIHDLCTNTELRSCADLFRRAIVAALIYEQFERNSAFFTAANDFDADTNRAVFKGLLLRHMQTAPCNFHSITEKQLANDGPNFNLEDIGGGAYSFLSMINHSCSPNVIRHSYGSAQVLRALQLIKKGEELLDNYGMHYAVMEKSERQQGLQSQYYFACKCRACLEDWPLHPELQVLEGQPNISSEDIEELQDAKREDIPQILKKHIDKARALAKLSQPSGNLGAVQEAIKECFLRLANTRFID